MEAHKVKKLVKKFPLFKDVYFSLQHHLTVTLVHFATKGTRYRVLLNTTFLVRRSNYEKQLSKCDMFIYPHVTTCAMKPFRFC